MVSVPCCKNTKAKVSKPHRFLMPGVVSCFSLETCKTDSIWIYVYTFRMSYFILAVSNSASFFFELQTSAVNFSYCCCSKLYEIPRYRGIARISFSLISLVLIRAVCIYAQGTSTFQYTCIDRLTWCFAAAAAVIVYV